MEERVFAGRFRVTEQVAATAYSETFKAVDDEGKPVAVRLFHARDAETAERLQHLAESFGRVSHANVATLLDSGREGADFFFVREFVPGVRIDELEEGGPLAPARAARYAAEICAALSVAHGRGVVHGSLGPSDVIVGTDDVVKVAGFGTWAARGTTTIGVETPREDVHYLSPEQIAGEIPEPASDVYAVGAILYRLVTGTVPFDADTGQHVAQEIVEAPPEPPRRVRPEVPASVEAIVLRAMNKDPWGRYGSAEEMRHDLERVYSAPAFVPPPERRPVWPWVVLTVALVAVGAMAAAWVTGLVGANVRVPDLTRLAPDEARTALADAGIRLGAVSYEGTSVPGIPDGTVSSQEPLPKTLVGKGTAVDIVLAGVESAVMPGVIGQTEAQAVAALTNAGFVVGNVIRVFDAKAEEGRVTSQTPVPGAHAPKGSAVLVAVSKGVKVTAIPDVVGTPEADARSALTKAGFKIGARTDHSFDVSAGVVMGQSPAGGVPASVGTTVTITVSAGPQFVSVPNVVGLTESQAIDAIEAEGLDAATVTAIDPQNVGKVVAQNPVAGTQMRPGGRITITVGK